MEVLLVEKDPLIRDTVKVALQQFSGFTVTVGQGHAGVSEARSKTFDCIFLGVDPKKKETMKLLHHLRSFDTTTELFVLTASKNVKDMQVDKSKYDIHSFVHTPIQVRDFFGLLGRFIERRSERQKAAGPRGDRHPAPSLR